MFATFSYLEDVILTHMKNVKNTSTPRDNVNSMYLLSDRQGYSFGYGLQWSGIRKDLTDPLNLMRKVKPVKMNINAQNAWLHPTNREIQSNTPFKHIR